MKSWVILGVCMILLNQSLAAPDNSADAWLAVINNDVQNEVINNDVLNEVVEPSRQEQPKPQQYSPQDHLQRQFEQFEAPAPSQRQAPDYTDVEAQPVQPPAPQPQLAVQDVYQQQYPPPRRNVPQTRREPPPAPRNAPRPGAFPRPGPNNRVSPGAAPRPGSRRRPRPRPRPRPGSGGIVSAIAGGLGNIRDGIQCAASDLWADSKLQDPKFVDAQMKCLLNEGPCDETGKLVKRLAPDILAKRCPPPCTPCIMKKVRGMMAKVQTENPQLWSKMIQQIATRPG